MSVVRLRTILGWSLVLVLSAGTSVSARAQEPKLTVAQILAKHLETLASAETRAAAKTRASEWTVHYVVKMGGQGMAEGKSVFITEGRKLALGMRFPVPEYAGEYFVFDGEKWDTARRTTELRSPLADLVLDNGEILRDGLLGGVLSTAWPLLNLAGDTAKLRYDGIKKIEGVALHRVSYTPDRVTNGMQIFLFFDPQTFRHVKTIYLLEIQPGSQPVQYTRNADVRYTPSSRYKLEEDFSDFKQFYGFTLPTKWKLRYTWEPSSRGGETMIDWELVMARVANNEPVDPKTFLVSDVHKQTQ
jgi:hypothetical protein